MRKWIILLGVTALIGMGGFFGYKQYSKPKQIELVVQNYVQFQSQGNTNKAMAYLTGEAKQLIGSVQYNQADPLKKISYIKSSEDNGLGEVSAQIVTQRDVISENFYLIKQGNDWKIFSIQLSPQDWGGVKSYSLTPEQKNSIDVYTKHLATGDVKNAMNMLVGDARIRAANTPNTIPKQTIRVDSVIPEEQLANGDVLALVKETINGTRQETLLYTLAKAQNWKIEDIRLIERR